MIDVSALVEWSGYLGLALIVFAETGLMVGFFLPGDSLLVTAGLFAANGKLDILFLNVLLIAMAIAGDATGYLIGRRLGPAIFGRKSSRLFRREHLIRTQLFYERHGGKTIILARFIPILRTFAPVVAGVAGMNYRRFAFFNISGGIAWVVSMTMTGFLLGRMVPNIAGHIEIVIVLVVALSLLPPVVSGWNERVRSRRRRVAFCEGIRQMADVIRTTHWDWSPAEVQRIVHSITVGREATAILREGETADEPVTLHVAEDEGKIAGLEIIAAVSPDRESLSLAGREHAGMEISARFGDAVGTLSEAFDRPESITELDRDTGALPPEVVRMAVWRLSAGRLALLQRSRLHRHEISLWIEPAGAATDRISA